MVTSAHQLRIRGTVRPFDDDTTLVNMTVRESVEALDAFVYRSDHRDYLRRRREWFERAEGPVVALWWVEAGHIPTVAEAKERLEVLDNPGPTREAFTFRSRFPAPAGVV